MPLPLCGRLAVLDRGKPEFCETVTREGDVAVLVGRNARENLTVLTPKKEGGAYRPSLPRAGALRGSCAGLWATGAVATGSAAGASAPEGSEPNVRCAITMSTNRAASPTAMFFSCQLTLVEYPTPRQLCALLSTSGGRADSSRTR
jgi:hypothetical protein